MSPRVRRLIMVVLPVLGLVISSMLAAFQLGISKSVWEPFFGSGSRAVLHSKLSHALPVPDALLGAAAYLVEALLVLQANARARTVVLGALALAMAFGGVFLTLYSLLWVRAACTLCLVSAGVSVMVASFVVPEVLERLSA